MDFKEARAWIQETHPELNIGNRGRLPENLVNEYKATLEDDVVDGEFIDEVTPLIPEESMPVKENKHKVRAFFTPKAKPAKLGKRVSVESVIGMAYGLVATVVKQIPGPNDTPALLPISRVMEMQAPAVGIVVDDLVKGTIFDRVLQPIARTGKSGEAVWGIIGPPVLVGAIMTQPGMQGVLVPMLRESLKSYVIVAGPAMKKAKEREEKLMAELGMEPDKTIDALIEQIFAPVVNTDGN